MQHLYEQVSEVPVDTKACSRKALWLSIPMSEMQKTFQPTTLKAWLWCVEAGLGRVITQRWKRKGGVGLFREWKLKVQPTQISTTHSCSNKSVVLTPKKRKLDVSELCIANKGLSPLQSTPK